MLFDSLLHSHKASVTLEVPFLCARMASSNSAWLIPLLWSQAMVKLLHCRRCYSTSVSQQINIYDLLTMSRSVIPHHPSIGPIFYLQQILTRGHRRANDKLVTQVLCFMFLHYCLLFHMEIGSIEANWSSPNNGPIDFPEEQFELRESFALGQTQRGLLPSSPGLWSMTGES